MDFLAQAQNDKERLVACRRALHRIPELNANLPQTTAFVCKELDGLHIPYTVIPEGGIVAHIGNSEGPRFLLRADMDALPIREQSGEVFSSENGNMHACGHDIHTTMLLGAAKLLKEQEAALKGGVTLLFQYNEEGVAGMAALLKAGILDKPGALGSMALHLWPALPAGQMFCQSGPVSAAVSHFGIDIMGSGAHGATPHKGVNPINVAAHIYLGLQNIINHEVAASETAVLTVGYLRAGAVSNIIPDRAELGGTIRSFDQETADFITGRVREIANSTAQAFNAGCEVSFPLNAPVCVNDAELTALARAVGAGAGIESVDIPIPTVSEDFALLAERVPSCFIWIGAGGPEEKYANGRLHDPKVCFNEAVIPLGAALTAGCAWKKLAEYGG